MRFLIDQPVSPFLAVWLRSADGGGHDAVHVRERGLSRAADVELLSLARDEQRVIVTADLDFPRLLALGGHDGPGLVLFRAGNLSDLQMLTLLERVLSEVGAGNLPRLAVVVDEKTIRITQLPIRRST